MANEYRVKLDASGRRVGVVVSRFNDFVTRRLVDGAVDCLVSHGVEDTSIDVYWVAGSFELPQMAARLARDSQPSRAPTRTQALCASCGRFRDVPSRRPGNSIAGRAA